MHRPLSVPKAQGSVTARSVLLCGERRLGILDLILGEFAMTEPIYDLLIRGGRVATVSDVFEADVAISGGTIVAVGRSAPGAREETDAGGNGVRPGGVDSHAHIEQLSAAGIMNADTFESATVSAAFGGTTNLNPFAAQHGGHQPPQRTQEY